MKQAILVCLLAFPSVCDAGGGGGYGGAPSLVEPFMHVSECLDKNAREIKGTEARKRAGQCERVGVGVIDSKNAEFLKR